MPLSEPQQREVAQLLLVARAYLALAEPDADRAIRLSETKSAFASGARVSLADWSRAMRAAHLASAAIRLASIDEVFDKANAGRGLYRECRGYFGRRTPIAEDPRGSSCSEWFHVMLRDAIAHIESPEEGAAHDEARQRCIETTTFGEAHARLEQTADELAEVLAEKGIVLPGLAKPTRA